MLGIILGGLLAAAAPDTGRTGPAEEADPSAWRETGLYRLRLEALRTCDPPAKGSAALVPGSFPSSTWMGVEVRAVAKVNELYVTARDFALEQGGIIVQARHVNPPLLGRCLPLLQRKQLRVQQSVRGFVLFEVPARFRSGDGRVLLAYRPTRWGGAPRVEFQLPPCLGGCGGDKPEGPASSPVPATPAKF